MRKKRVIILITLIFTCTAGIEAQEKANYISKYRTITHELLQLEKILNQKSGSEYDGMFKLLDSIIDISSKEINPILEKVDLDKREKAIEVLKSINNILQKLNFTLVIYTDTLTEMLSEKRMDCDTGAMLYLAIAEVLELPIYNVTVPKHSFVRYYYKDMEYLNWDNNTAMFITNISPVYTDSDFMHGRSSTSSTTFSIDDAARFHYLQPMSKDDIRGYFYTQILSVDNLDEQKTKNVLEKSLKLRPFSHLSMNNLAWFLLTSKKYHNSPENIKIAYDLAIKATNLYENNEPYLDTLGCACAATGDFEMAEYYEKNGGGNNLKQILGYQNGKNCFELGYTPAD